jgi:hypothetical protein
VGARTCIELNRWMYERIILLSSEQETRMSYQKLVLLVSDLHVI